MHINSKIDRVSLEMVKMAFLLSKHGIVSSENLHYFISFLQNPELSHFESTLLDGFDLNKTFDHQKLLVLFQPTSNSKDIY